MRLIPCFNFVLHFVECISEAFVQLLCNDGITKRAFHDRQKVGRLKVSRLLTSQWPKPVVGMTLDRTSGIWFSAGGPSTEVVAELVIFLRLVGNLLPGKHRHSKVPLARVESLVCRVANRWR